MSLDMLGHIDDCFESVPTTRYRYAAGSYVEGIWTEGTQSTTTHKATIQPTSEKELEDAQIMLGAERILDARTVYINDGSVGLIKQSDEWEFEGIDGRFKTHKIDNRPWRNYAKILVMIIDDKPKA